MNRVPLLLLLLIGGCKTPSDESEPFPKQGQAIAKPPLHLPAEASAKRNEVHAENKPVMPLLPDTEEVGVVACEYVITNMLGTVPSGTCVHVELSNGQLQSLKARLPKHDIRSMSDANKRLCPKIRVNQVKILNPVARAELNWTAQNSVMNYVFYLSNTSGWTVTNVWGSGAISN